MVGGAYRLRLRHESAPVVVKVVGRAAMVGEQQTLLFSDTLRPDAKEQLLRVQSSGSIVVVGRVWLER